MTIIAEKYLTREGVDFKGREPGKNIKVNHA
jgi:hypothetical protein